MRKKIVFSLGGSLIVPGVGTIDTAFLKKFITLLKRFADQYDFYLIVGGGRTARVYQQAARDLKITSHEILDGLGIATTRLNAALVKSACGVLAAKELIVDPENIKIDKKAHVYVGGGWKPGWSTDYVAVKVAEKLGIKTVVNLSNIDYIYDQDPRNNPKAKALTDLTWAQFRALVGNKWSPGANLPFDPVACLLAEKLKLELVVMNGANMVELAKLLKGKKIKGSIVA